MVSAWTFFLHFYLRFSTSFLTWKTKQFYFTFLLFRSIAVMTAHLSQCFITFFSLPSLLYFVCVSPKCWYLVPQNSIVFSFAADLVWFSLHALASELLLQYMCLADGVSLWPELWGRSACTFPKINPPKYPKVFLSLKPGLVRTQAGIQ